MSSLTNLFTPTTVCAPESIRAWVRAAASSILSFGRPRSMALAMPPIASTSSMCAIALSASVMRQALDMGRAAPGIDQPRRRRSPAQGPAGCCGRCGRRSRSAAPAPRRRRWCAATGCAPASPPSPRRRFARRCSTRPARSATSRRSGMCVRSDSERGSCGAKCLRISFAQSRRAARSLATSMKKFMPIAQKNDRRGAKWSIARPAGDAGAGVFDAVRDRIGELEIGRRARPPACGSRRSRSSCISASASRCRRRCPK